MRESRPRWNTASSTRGQTSWFNSTATAAAAQILLSKPDTVREFVLQGMLNDPNFAVQSSHAQPGTVGDQSVYVTIQGKDTESGLPLDVQTYVFIRGRVFVLVLRMGVDFQSLGLNITPENDIALEELAYLLDLRAQEVQGLLP